MGSAAFLVEVVFGVDLNPIAVELGQISLWLNCLHKGKSTQSNTLEPVAKLFGTPLITPSNQGNVFRIHPTVVKAIF